MFVSHVDEIDSVSIEMDDVRGAHKQVLVGPDQGWDDHVMRRFSLEPGGHTPKHAHPWPHINYIVSGTGTLHLDGTDHPLKPGAVAYVPGGTVHQFRNDSEAEFSFLCIVPKEGES